MDIATVIGFGLITAAVLGSILAAGDIGAFIDVPSVLVVGLGVIGATFVKWPLEVVTGLVPVIMKAFFFSPTDPKATIEEIGQLAETARRESVFALEKVPIDDPFLKKACTLAADNRPPEVISAVLQLEIDAMVERHKFGSSILGNMKDDGPAMGMIGTLIGLVQMLQSMDDPSTIGPAMAVALLTTFYGSLMANICCMPIAGKLKTRSKEEMLTKEMTIQGIMSLSNGDNPRILEQKLVAFLPHVKEKG